MSVGLMQRFFKTYSALMIMLMFTLFAPFTLAQKATELYKLRVNNPDQSINYIVGDTFTRSIEIDIQQPYQLLEDSLPQLSINHQGLELKSVKLDSKQFLHNSHYAINLTYQIFDSEAYTKKYKLLAHSIKIQDANKLISIKIPEWQFRVSPIATHNENEIFQDISPYRMPIIVDSSYAKAALAIFFCLTVISVLVLIYLNADRSWFPGMGGPFAKSYREIQSSAEMLHALASVHHAFNQTFKESLFLDNIDDFLANRPEFKSIRAEIVHFFTHSYHFQFGSNKESQAISLADVIDFCLLCRDCERNIK